MIQTIIPVYKFAAAPPVAPKLYFTERHLRELALYGSLACPHQPPQRTIFPDTGNVGRWTLHYDEEPTINIYEAPDPMTQLMNQLPGMRMRYEDLATGNTWVWVLTDKVLRHFDDNIRFAVWPD